VKKKVQDERTIKHPFRHRRGKFKPPDGVINDNTEARRQQIRSFASIIVNILLSDNIKDQL